MSVRAGQILHYGNTFILNRLQSAGPTSLNVPIERIRETGNYQTVGIVRDTPDLTFEVESWDASIDLEAITMGLDPDDVTTQALDFNDCMPVSVVSPFRSSNAAFTVVEGVAIPHLTLESVAYRFGVRQNAAKTFTYRGDSIFYIPGSPRVQASAGGSASYALAAPNAIPYVESGQTIYALDVTWVDTTTGLSKRLFRGTDFTDSATTVNLTAGTTIPATATVYITYGSTGTETLNAGVNEVESSTHPAAIRSRDLDVYVGGAISGATPVQTLIRGVQSMEITRRVNLENDEEFGNPHFVSQDYDTADVTGSITIRPEDPDAFVGLLQLLSDVSSSQIVGPYTSPPRDLEIVLHDPSTGAALETLYVEDATFTIPPYQARVQQKLDITLNWESQGGNLVAYKGERTWV